MIDCKHVILMEAHMYSIDVVLSNLITQENILLNREEQKEEQKFPPLKIPLDFIFFK